MAQRIFTLVGRTGTVVMTDSKLKAGKKAGSYELRKGEDTQLEALKLLNEVLGIIPRNVKFSSPVVFLLSNNVSFLAYEDTRSYWLENKHKKGDPEKVISDEILAQVQILHDNLAQLKDSVRLFGQKGIKSPVYNSYIKASWDLMNNIVEKPVTVDANEAF